MLNKKNIVLISRIVLLIIVGGIWFFRAEIKDFINRAPNTPVITFPAVEESRVLSKDFDIGSLALEMSRFVPEEATEKEFWRLKYVGLDSAKNIGLDLKYKLSVEQYSPQKFYERQLGVIKNNGWELLSANIEDSQMFLDMGRKNSGADYKVRISAEQKNGFLGVEIQYLITRY